MEEVSSVTIVLCSFIIVLFYFGASRRQDKELKEDEEEKVYEGEREKQKNQLRQRILRRQE